MTKYTKRDYLELGKGLKHLEEKEERLEAINKVKDLLHKGYSSEKISELMNITESCIRVIEKMTNKED